MNKKLLLLVALVAMGSSLEAQSKLKTKIKRPPSPEHNRSWFYEAGAGGAFYHVKRGTFLDIGSNTETVKNGKSKIAPLGMVTVGAKWDNMPAFSARGGELGLGLRGYYAGRKDGVTVDYFEGGLGAAPFVIKQKVQDARLSFVADYLCLDGGIYSQRFTFNVLGALVLSFKTLGNLKVYEKPADAYIGQYLKPVNVNVLGEIGGTFTYSYCDHWYAKAGYSYTGGRIRYKTQVFLETPDAAAGAHHADALRIPNPHLLQLPKKPQFTVGVQMFYFVVGGNF